MSYRPHETGYDDILRRPDITISRSTWDLACAIPGHGPYVGPAWNAGCPCCKLARAVAQRAARDARFHERVKRVHLAGGGARGGIGERA